MEGSMSEAHVINVDLADVWSEKERKKAKLIRTLAWGDEIAVHARTNAHVEIRFTAFQEADDGSVLPKTTTGYIIPTKASGVAVDDVTRPKSENKVLKVNFVDVQQGDGCVIESPAGKVILVDGGDNQLFARYLAGRFRGTSKDKPQPIECILVTHGDADHFDGLSEIIKSETHKEPRKRLVIQPKRIYHNGIVKRPSKMNGKNVPDTKLLGRTKEVDGDLYLVGLEENLLDVDPSEMNQPFKSWRAALAAYKKRGPLEFRRLEFGDDDAFDFLGDEKIKVSVLGPLTKKIGGKSALKFLGDPPKGPRIGHESVETTALESRGHSASHTINGHSIIFKMTYGGISYLFSGDLNDEAGRFITMQHEQRALNLQSEVFKVPHHGSADFSGAFIKAVAPIVSVVSSGDESAKKEYIHPRATLVGALGKYSRVAEPLIFITELVAFFNLEGWSKLSDAKKSKARGEFFAFSRAAYGMVKTRTDGQRLLVYTDSANLRMKEAYAYALDNEGVPQPAPVVRV
jgi:beta-lactamase superfamily II metal-dependent hydrolase